MSPVQLFASAYLVLGMGTTLALWQRMGDEIELSMSTELGDDDDRPAFRAALTVFFLLAWPLLVADVMRRR